MTLEDNGNVGIGTTNPSAKLHVDGTLIATGISQLGSGGSNVYLTSSSAGSVGIGTTSPDSKLDVTGGDITVNTTGTGFMNFKYSGSQMGTIGTDGIDLKITANADLQLLPQGNVGIGTTNPASKLHVQGNSFFFDQAIFDDKVGIGTSSPSSKLHITSASSAIATIEAKNPTAFNDPQLNFVTWNEASGSSSGKIQLTNGTFNSNDMAFFTETANSVTEKMRITSSGNVGIGTASPLLNLQINSNTNANSTIAYSENNTLKWYTRHNASDDSFQIVDVPNATTALNIASGGNVGIGTTSPQQRLTVGDGSGSEIISIYAGNTNASAVHFTDTNTSTDYQGFVSYNHSSDALRFGTAEVERMRITSTGNVGIGTTAPDSFNSNARNLVVNSSSSTGISIATTDTNADSSLIFADGTGGTAGYRGAIRYKHNGDYMQFDTSASERMRITNDGLLFVGDTNTSYGYQSHHIARDYSQGYALIVRNSNTTTQNNSVLQLNQAETTSTTQGFFLIGRQGDPNTGANRILIYSNGNVANVNNSYGAISDERLKENIVDATPKLDDLMKVKIRNYNFIGQEDKQIGVIAQEIENVFPSLVEDTKDPESEETTKSVKYSVLVPIMLKAIQELKAEVEELKSK